MLKALPAIVAPERFEIKCIADIVSPAEHFFHQRQRVRIYANCAESKAGQRNSGKHPAKKGTYISRQPSTGMMGMRLTIPGIRHRRMALSRVLDGGTLRSNRAWISRGTHGPG